MKYIKLFENHGNDVSKYGYYDLSNAYVEGILEELEVLKESAGNYISFSYKYDPMSNFIEIEAMGDKWINSIYDIVLKNEGKYNGVLSQDNKLTDDGMSIYPMKFH
jgi:hypothetical protein